jgi:hypothetical protein
VLLCVADEKSGDPLTAPPVLDQYVLHAAEDGVHVPLAYLRATNTGHLLRRIFVRLTNPHPFQMAISVSFHGMQQQPEKAATSIWHHQLKMSSCRQRFRIVQLAKLYHTM